MKKKASLLLIAATALFAGFLIAFTALSSIPGGTFTVKGVREQSEPSADYTDRDRGKININTADAEVLADLPGIGPALAERILAYRDEHGPFGSIDDLLAVKGIGEAILEGLRPYAKVTEGTS